MENEKKDCGNWEMCEHKCKGKMGGSFCGGGIYGLGFVGALIFFIQNSETFWIGVLGVLKAAVWPVFLVYELFGHVQ